MPVINPTLPADGDTAAVEPYNAALQLILGVLNGSIDQDNLAALGVTTSRIADLAVTNAKVANNTLDLSAKAASFSGLIPVTDTWSFSSSTTITVPTDATTKYDIGDLVQLVQGGVTKNFVVTGLTSTQLTVTGLAAATVANSAITNIFYAKVRNPHGVNSGAMLFNPYKFFAYRNAVYAPSSNTVLVLDTKAYDTGSNFNVTTGLFTAPVAGFYQFDGSINFLGGNALVFAAGLTKNGAEYTRGDEITATGTVGYGLTVGRVIQLAAGDTVGLLFGSSNSGPTTMNVGASPIQTCMSGFLLSLI